MEIEDAQYDSSTTAELLGHAGLFRGEEARLAIGQSLIVGRSRLCTLSVARARECLRMSKEALEAHHSYRKISRQHFKVSLTNADTLEVEDLSTNGTVVNGYRIDKIMIAAFTSGGAEVKIEFGAGELITVRSAGAAPSSFPRTQAQRVTELDHTP